MITITDTEGSGKEFYFKDIFLGSAHQEVDGFYVFEFNKGNTGFWSEYSLRLIADELEKLNKPWAEQILEYYNSTKPQ